MLIELRIEHADLNALIDRYSQESVIDELMLRRLKRRRLSLKDAIVALERQTAPQEPA
jgi:hypothetical protein